MWADQLKKIDSSSVHIGRYWEVHGLVNWTIKNIISRKKSSDKKAVLRLVEHISNDATMQREKVILSFPTYLMYSAWVKNHYADIMRTNSSLTST